MLLGEVIREMIDIGIRIGYYTAWKIKNKALLDGSIKSFGLEQDGYNLPSENNMNLYEPTEAKRLNLVLNLAEKNDILNPLNTKLEYESSNCLGVKVSRKNQSIFEVSNNIEDLNSSPDTKEEDSLKEDKVRKSIIESGNAFYLDDEDEISDENEDEIIFNKALKGFVEEFKGLNKTSICIAGQSMIYIRFPFMKYLRNVLEVKIYIRKRGCVIYGIGYDPLDKPIIVSFVVSENSVEISLGFFFENEPETYENNDNIIVLASKEPEKNLQAKANINETTEELSSANKTKRSHNGNLKIIYLIEYDETLINIFNSLKVNYFVKTRSICKRFELSDIDRVFKIINYEQSGDLCINLDPQRYIASRHQLFGINNFSEVDVDFIFYAVYNFDFFDCLNSIIKLASDHMKEKNCKSFGENVTIKIERSKKMNFSKSLNYDVDLQNFWCSCGRYQTFLIPCPHACSLILSRGEDPLEHVSSVYDPKIIDKLDPIIPVVDVPVKCQPDRLLLRRGPGRPKKLQGIINKG